MASISRLTFAAALAVAALAGGCRKGVHEAIKQPLAVMPTGAKAVLIADIASSRTLPNFRTIEQFIRESGTGRGDGGGLPFDYQEQIDHTQVDYFRNIDQLVIGLYDDGWLSVRVGQFYPDHLIGLARDAGLITGQSQRGEEDAVYTVLAERQPSPPLLVSLAQGWFAPLAGWRQFGFVARALADSGEIFEAWPSEHIWIRSNSQSLLNLALDLWEDLPAESLLDDAPFMDLYSSRPHSALAWLGVPRTVGLPQPISTLQIEIDIRDYITPTVIFGYETAESADAQLTSIDRPVQALAAVLANISAIQAADPWSQDPSISWILSNDMEEIATRVSGGLRTTLIREAKVIEVRAPLQIEDFKTLFAALAREIWTER